MDERTLRVKLVASVAGFKAGLGEGAAEVRAFGRQVSTSTGKARQDFDQLGRAGVVLGAGIATGFGMAAKAAIGFESAFAGVRKTVDGTDRELADIRNGIREMSRGMPTSANEIARVAAAAGALGVQTPNILKFSRTMVMLGEATDDLPAEAAAVAMARLMNIMQTAPDDVDRVAAALVDLGNNGASTEGQIVEMATRIASAARQVGMTEADVLALANALSSVGMEAEAGGSSISRVIIEMQNAVMDGGEALTTFAETAGMTAQEFAAAFRADPALALISFVEGLRRLGDQGANTNAVLEELGLNDIRVGNSLRSLAGAGDLARESLERGEQAFKDNSALQEEYERRLETTGAQLQILKNNVVDLAISAGEVLLPAITNAAEAGVDFLNFIREMPAPVKVVVTTLGALAGVVGLVGGATLLAAPRIKATRDALTMLSGTAPRVATGLGMAAKGMVGLGVGATAIGIVMGLSEAFRQLGGTIEGHFADALANVGKVATAELLDTFTNASDRMEFFEAVLESNAGAAERLRDAWASAGADIDATLAASDLPTFLESMDAALAENQRGLDLEASGADGAAAAVGDFGAVVSDAGDDVQTLSDALDDLFDRTFGLQGATDNLTSGVLAWVEAVQAAKADGNQFATSLSATSVEGLRNREVLRGLVEDAGAVAEQMVAMGQDPVAAMEQLRAELIETAVRLGFNRDEAANFFNVLQNVGALVVTPTVDLNTNPARQKLQDLVNTAQGALAKIFGAFGGGGDDWQPWRIPLSEPISSGPSLMTGIPAGVGNVLGGRSGRGAVTSSSAASDAEARAREAEAAMQRAWEVTDNAYNRGLYALDDYLRELDRRQALYAHLTPEWEAIQARREQVLRDHATMLEEIHGELQAQEDRQYAAGRLSNQEFRAILRERFDIAAEEHGYWSREAQDIYQDIVALDERVIAAQERAADEARRRAEDRQRKAEDEREKREREREQQLQDLNRLLDDERSIRKQMEDLERAHHQRLADLGTRYNDDQRQILSDRESNLVGWADIAERVQIGWGNSVAALASNVADQIAVFDEWSDALEDARSRGVSEAVIDMLGLAEGPQALGQLRMFSSATQAEIDLLNTRVEERTRQAGDQVGREQAQTYSDIGRQLAELAERNTAEIEAATEEFLAEQRELRDELAALGQDTGRSYAEAIRLGLQSEIEAVRAAARELQDAIKGDGPGSQTKPSPVGSKGPTPTVGKYIPKGSAIPPGYKYLWENSQGIRVGSYDSGGFLPTGWSMAYNGTGRPEPVGHDRAAQVNVAPTFIVEVYDANGHLVTDDRMRVVVREENHQHAQVRGVVGTRGA